MKIKYRVRLFKDNMYEVIKIITHFGERTSAYDSEPDRTTEEIVFKGNLADCESYIRLTEGGYM